MTAQAYVSIRPTHETPILLICRPCHIEEPARRWNDALDAAKLHNLEHHPENEEQQ